MTNENRMFRTIIRDEAPGSKSMVPDRTISDAFSRLGDALASRVPSVDIPDMVPRRCYVAARDAVDSIAAWFEKE